MIGAAFCNLPVNLFMKKLDTEGSAATADTASGLYIYEITIANWDMEAHLKSPSLSVICTRANH